MYLILYRMLENFPLHRGHSAFTWVSSLNTKTWNLKREKTEKGHLAPLLEAGEAKLVQTRVCHALVFHLRSSSCGIRNIASFTSPRQMGQVDSSGETGRPSRDLDFRFLLCQEYYSTLAQDFILA